MFSIINAMLERQVVNADSIINRKRRFVRTRTLNQPIPWRVSEIRGVPRACLFPLMLKDMCTLKRQYRMQLQTDALKESR